MVATRVGVATKGCKAASAMHPAGCFACVTSFKCTMTLEGGDY